MLVRTNRLRAVLAALLAMTATPSTQTAMPAGPVSTAGYCLSFDGIDDFVAVTRSTALEPAEITVELWARLDGPQDWNTRLLRKGEQDAYFIAADQDLDQRMQLLVTMGTEFKVQAKDTQPHTDYLGTWHHFLGIYAVDHAEFWVDGVQASSVTHDLGALTHLPLTDLYIGAGLPVPLQNEYFAGRVDEIRIWNYSRTSAQIHAAWNHTLLGDEAGLVAYWRFDEGSGQVAHDSSPFGHHGRLGATRRVEASDPAWAISDAPLLGPVCKATSYCIAGINSTGEGAHIGYQGSTSIALNDLVLEVNHCPPKQLGMFFLGSAPTQVPVGDGYLCVCENAQWLSPLLKTDDNGAASLPIDFTKPSSPASLIEPGMERYFQFWYLDSAMGGSGDNLSDALYVRFCP